MSRNAGWNDEFDDADDWADASYEQDSADADEPTIACPYCRREIHEDSPRCPHCEQYISKEDAPPSPKPWWLIAGVAVCLAIVCIWIFGI